MYTHTPLVHALDKRVSRNHSSPKNNYLKVLFVTNRPRGWERSEEQELNKLLPYKNYRSEWLPYKKHTTLNKWPIFPFPLHCWTVAARTAFTRFSNHIQRLQSGENRWRCTTNASKHPHPPEDHKEWPANTNSSAWKKVEDNPKYKSVHRTGWTNKNHKLSQAYMSDRETKKPKICTA